jgi:GNAT superfamily N-acetyltransferase
VPIGQFVWFTPADGEAYMHDALSLAANRLGDSQGLRKCWERHPALVVCCRESAAVIGICFGAPSAKGAGEAELRGIAVAAARVGRGIGSVLLELFEAAAARAGYARVGVGSAPGYVERFYLSHGYELGEFMVRMPPGVEPPQTAELTILRRRMIDGCVAFNLAAAGHTPEATSELKRRLGAAEVISIFYKALSPAEGAA